MTLYSLVLFGHVTAVLALFACLSLETLSLFICDEPPPCPKFNFGLSRFPASRRLPSDHSLSFFFLEST